MNIDNMRNMAAKMAIEYDCDYLCFIDDDVLVPFNAIDQLLQCDADVAAGWTIIRGWPYKNMFFRWTDEAKTSLENWPSDDVPVGVIDVDAVGFSCALIKVSLLKAVEKPFFVTGPYNTEDIYFCVKARLANPNCSIRVNADLKTFHKLDSLFVSPDNRAALKDYEEAVNPELKVFVPPPFDTPEVQAERLGDPKHKSYEATLKEAIWPNE